MKVTRKKNVNDSKNNTRKRPISFNPNLPFEDVNSTSDANSAADPSIEGEFLANGGLPDKEIAISDEEAEKRRNLAGEFEAQGNNLAEEGKYCEALGKWEVAITLMPEKATLHEWKTKVRLELGEPWSALRAATSTELDPRWAVAWITLGRTQLNFGEPDFAIESFDKALAIKPDSVEAKEDRKAASQLVKRGKQLHSTGLSSTENRFLVGDQG